MEGRHLRVAGAPEAAAEHEIVPRPDYLYSAAGANTGRPANLLYASHYPIESMCCNCPEMIRRESLRDGWEHTGRKPGDPSVAAGAAGRRAEWERRGVKFTRPELSESGNWEADWPGGHLEHSRCSGLCDRLDAEWKPPPN